MKKIFKSLLNISHDLITSGLGDELSLEIVRKFIMVNLIAVIGISFLIPFGIYAILSESLFIGIIDLFIAILLFLSAFYLRKTKTLNFSAITTVIFMGAFFIILLISGEGVNSAHMWSFLYPLAVMFLLGRKKGILASVIFLVVVVIFFLIPTFELTFSTYFKLRFIGAFLALTVSTYLFESVRETTEKRMLEAIEFAQRSDQLKSEFLAQMSHEIRTPINSIINFTSLLINEKDVDPSEDEKIYLEYIQNASERLIRTIDLILNMSEIELGTYETKFEKIDLVHSVLKPTCAEFKNEAMEKGLKLVCQNKVEESSLVEVDKYTITQSVVNLIDNAIKYTDEGEVSLRYYKDNEKFVIEVSDTGVGISDEFMPHLFDKFSQEDQGYARKFEGNGLGLALVKKYCDINNASISVKSVKGEGATFTIIL